MISKNFMSKVLSRLDKVDPDQLKSFIKTIIEDTDMLYRMWDHSYAGIIIFNEYQEVRYINQKALEILRHGKLKPEEALGKHIDDILPNQDFKIHLHHKINKNEKMHEEEHILGHPLVRVIRASFYPVTDTKTKVRFYMLLFVDITRRKLEDIKNRRKENIASMMHLAAGLAHEIKNPLASVDIHLKLMKRYLDNAPEFEEKNEMKDFLGVLQEEINRLNSIVQDFLSSMRPISLDLTRVNVEAVMKDLINFLNLELKKNQIQIALNLEDYLPFIYGDQKYLRIIFLNLLKNAIEAFPASQTDRQIEIQIYENAPFVVTKIIDNGPGIAEDKIEKIFDPYFTTKSFGTGIGLTMVHKIVTEHNGSIKVDSIPGKGSVFTLALPLYQGETAKILESSQKQESRQK